MGLKSRIRHSVRRRFTRGIAAEKSGLIRLILLAGLIFAALFPVDTFAATHVSGNITTDTTWTLAGSPYIVTGDVNVFHPDGKSVVTLTIDPGVEVRFETSTALYIGGDYNDTWGWYGALYARGTDTAPIIFTSSAAEPSPGNWKGIIFTKHTNVGATTLEHSVVEYAENCITLAPDGLTLRYNSIRYGRNSGVYVEGYNEVIECNTFFANVYGVLIESGWTPSARIHNNNFIASSYFGVSSDSHVVSDAQNNWWGDPRGPGYEPPEGQPDDYHGDRVHRVDYSGWLSSESPCAPPVPQNRPPVAPHDPSPADGARDIPVVQAGIPLNVSLSWSGGDADPQDSVVYDLLLGPSKETLIKVAENISQNRYVLSGLSEGTLYYWQVVARDSQGEESTSGVWYFTTQLAPPFITGGQVASGVIRARPVQNRSQHTAVVLSGTRSDDTSLWINGSQWVNPGSGNWSVALELSEGENTLEIWLQNVAGVRSLSQWVDILVDTVAPALVAVSPVDNSLLNTTPDHVQVDFSEETSGLDLHAGTLVLKGSDQSEVAGNWTLSEAGRLRFIPESSLADGSYTLDLQLADRAGNRGELHHFHFTIDTAAPAVISSLTADGKNDGTQVVLNWSGYDESAYGDIASYRVYIESSAFSDVAALTPAATLPAGTFSYTIQNLSRGTPYWFAVVAVDQAGNAASAVSSVSATPNDIVPPEDAQNLEVQSFDTHLAFTWQPSPDAAGDLSAYKVYFNDDPAGELLPSSQSTYEKTGLNPASGYHFKVTAIDVAGNESTGLATTAATLLPNPAGLAAAAYSGHVDLTWQGAQPAQYVQKYRVYVSPAAFASVTGMTPVLTTTATSIKVAGLTNNTTYFFAVTTLNVSGGEQKSVTPISATPTADTQGPQIANVKADGAPVADGLTLTRAATITVNAADPSGVSRVEFYIDSGRIRTDYSGSPDYSCYLDVVSMDDGTHTLGITAIDTLGNASHVSYAITTAVSPPPAPTITQPTSGIVTNLSEITVSGYTQKGAEVLLYNNGVQVGPALVTDAAGSFNTDFTLSEGRNRIQAAARNRAGTGPLSAAIVIDLDTSIPESPAGLTAAAKAAGMVRLTWQAPADTQVAGYNLYRSSVGFASATEAEKVNTGLLGATQFEDLPPADGTWYYRVATQDTAGNESTLSNEVAVRSDRTAPRASRIAYLPAGNQDPATGRTAPGMVNVRLTVSESLQGTPFLSIIPQNGMPMTVALTKESDQVYSGLFVIRDTTPGGIAYAVFSARDAVGNRGTEIDAGATLLIDTDGPVVVRLAVMPGDPIKNDAQNPVALTVTLGLDEAIPPGDGPHLSYLLSGQDRSPVNIGALSQVTPQAGDVQTWQARFDLPPDAGLAEVESLHFIYQGTDDLGNVSNRILAKNRYQVYQGNLPPLDAPQEFAGTALAGGKIKLTWRAVPAAIGYQLYRQGPSESGLGAYQRLGTVAQFTDEPDTEGLYRYAITSVRAENGQEAESSQSPVVAVASDSTAPEAPFDLALELTPQGVKADWQIPAYAESVTYALYRSDQAGISSTEGLTPIVTGIIPTSGLDAHPSPGAHTYAVTAVDAAGNTSAPSASAYLNADLLPVTTLSVVQTDDQAPQIRWTHPGGDIAGFDIYLGPPGTKLNPSLLTDMTYTDTGFSDDERQYRVVAVDVSDHQSLARSIILPKITATPAADATLKRGVMNRLAYRVENLSAADLQHVRLKVRVGTREHLSDEFAMDPGASQTVSVPVGGYADLQDAEPVTTTIEITPAQGESVQIVRHTSIAVTDGMLVLQILNAAFVRGGNGGVRFTLQNTGDEDIEVLTATAAGSAASADITYELLDVDENVLSTAGFKQALGAGITTLANGDSVARIAAGATFTSAQMNIAVPANAPDDVTIRLTIGHIYHHRAKADQVTMDGLATTRPITLADTAYTGEITSIVPENSSGDQNVVISGRAVARDSQSPMAHVPLKLIITLDGFERTYDVSTGDDGTFSYAFTPLAQEGGIYTLRAVHPDVNDRPVQGQFVIERLTVAPRTINLSIPKNYEKTIPIGVTAGSGAALSNLHLRYVADDQPAGVLPAGIHVTAAPPVAALAEGQTAKLNVTLWADNTAPATATLVFKVASNENPDWASVVVQAHFSQAGPALFFTPDHVETGVALENMVTETVVLENRGLAPLEDVSVQLVSQQGNSIPSWAYLNAASDQGSLEVGDRREVNLTFSPGAAVAEGMYAFYLRVRAANYDTTDIRLYVAVTQSGVGNALFKISDIYTGTLDEHNGIVQGLSGARIYLQNEAVPTVSQTQVSDAFGEALFEDLPAGRYKYRITAANHQEQIGRIWIKPGITANAPVFLDYNLVTVQWDVTEITVEDRYDITLTATYETDVPAPVVVAEPAWVTLPKMQAGDVYTGEFSLTNYGLIRADKLTLKLPADDEFFHYDLMAGLPDHLNAKQRITVAYRVTCLQSPERSGEGTGGGDCYHSKCIFIGYEYTCVNGHCTRASIWHCTAYPYACPSGGSGGPAGPGPASIFYGGPGGSGSSRVTPPATAISGPQCFPKPTLKEWFFDKWQRLKDTWRHWKQQVGCSVNTITREFNDDAVDLTVKVPGGMLAVRRWFYGNQWHWEHLRQHLDFKKDALGNIKAIEKGGVLYEASSTGDNVFKSDIYRIASTADGWRWFDPHGNWKTFDEHGRMSAYGTRSGVLATLLYVPGEEGKLIGIADRNGRQVIWIEYDADDHLSAVRDADGRRVSYTYTDGQLTEISDVLGQSTHYEYDGDGRIIRKTDAAGRDTRMTYDSYGNVASVTDAKGQGHFFEYGYDEATKGTSAVTRSSSGRIQEVWFDRNEEAQKVKINGRDVETIVKDGRSLIITDEKGKRTRRQYDEWDNLTKIVYPDDSSVSIAYEHTFNRPIRITDTSGGVTEFAYDDQGNLIRKTEAAGSAVERVTTYTYDTDGQLLSATVEADAQTAAATTGLTYDDNGNLASITDPMGNVTLFQSYDASGNLLAMQDPRGYVWRFAYDALGRLTSRTDPLGNVTAYAYDGANNRTAIVNALLKRFEFEYDDHNNRIKAIDPYQKFIGIQYNSDNLPTQMTDQEGKRTFADYDSEGRLLSSTDGAGNQITYHYDESAATTVSSDKPVRIDYPSFKKKLYYDIMERVVRVSDVFDDSTSYSRGFAYDKSGNLTAVTDEEGNTTTFAYDALNRLVKTTDALGGEVTRRYDARGNLIERQDPNQGITWYEYDLNNRLVKVIRPMRQETTFAYDAAGNRIAETEAAGGRTEFVYDALNRLVQEKTYSATDPDHAVKTVNFNYDKLGRVTAYDDGVTAAAYTYDDLGRKTGESVDYGAFSLSTAYTYFANGLKKSFTGPDGVTITYSYDKNNRLAAVTIPGQGQVTWGYDSAHANRPAAKLLPGGSTTAYAYDSLMHTKKITAADPGQNPVMTRDYTYSPTGNLSVKATEHGSYQYQYDNLQRLTAAVNPVSADEAYSYDALGNRLTSAATQGSWHYNANSQLTGYDHVSFTYDDNGNIISKKADGLETRYVYDAQSRLTRVENESGAAIANYGYDPFGRRLWKEVDGEKTYFAYADEGLVGEYDAAGREIKTYGWAPGSPWGTDPLFVKTGGIYYWYRNDHRGTPQKITTTSGAVVWSAVYDAFGNSQISVETIISHLRFSGQYFDAETGLCYNLNRYYDPATGRYLQPDRLNQGLNLYAYVFNNPTGLIDPLGLCAIRKGGAKIKEWSIEVAIGALDGLEVSTLAVQDWLHMRFVVGVLSLGDLVVNEIEIIAGATAIGAGITEEVVSGVLSTPVAALAITGGSYSITMGAVGKAESVAHFIGSLQGSEELMNFELVSSVIGGQNGEIVSLATKVVGVVKPVIKIKEIVKHPFTKGLPWVVDLVRYETKYGQEALKRVREKLKHLQHPKKMF